MPRSSCDFCCNPVELARSEPTWRGQVAGILCQILAAIEDGDLGTDVNIAAYGGTPTTLGQKAMAASIPVVIASDQSGLTVLGTKAEDSASTTGDLGFPMLAVQTATPASTAADGDYGWLKTDALGKLWDASDQIEDTAAASGHIGSAQLLVRRDVGGAQTDTTGDYEAAQAFKGMAVNMRRPLYSTGDLLMTNGADTETYDVEGFNTFILQVTSAAAGGTFTISVSYDGTNFIQANTVAAPSTTGAAGHNWGNVMVASASGAAYLVDTVGAKSVRVGVGTTSTGTVAFTVAFAQTQALQATHAIAFGISANGPMKAEDAASASGDYGFAVWGIRRDTAATTCADGDYSQIAVNLNGCPLVDVRYDYGSSSTQGLLKLEDTTAQSGDAGVAVWGVLETTPTALAASGDYGAFKLNLVGAQYTEPANQVATWAAATIAGAAGGVTTAGANALTNSAKVKVVELLNTTDQVVQLSLDAGTTWVLSAVATNGIARIDLGTNGRWTASNIHVRSLGSNTSSGSVYISAMI